MNAVINALINTALGPVEYHLAEGIGPVVLASHGGLGGVDQARLLLGWLDPMRYRVLACSRPGYLNTPLSSGRGLAEQADLFAALLDALGIERVSVVTVSAGGPPGYLFAARHPERVAALVAIASVSGRYAPQHSGNRLAQALFMSDAGLKLAVRMTNRAPGRMARAMLNSTAHYSAEELQRQLDFTLGSPDSAAFLRDFTAALMPYRPRVPGNTNDTEQLRGLAELPMADVRCPTLVVHGTHDSDVPFCHGVRAYEQIAGAQRYWIAEGAHLGFWLGTGSAQAQTAARRFLDQVGAAARDPDLTMVDQTEQGRPMTW
jgi:pimeloyl-ACP methyl ester carboxylesterase